MPTEQDLTDDLHRARSGDRTSLERLCAEAKVRLLLVVKYRLRGWPEADREDLVQDTLVTFCEKIQSIEHTPMAFALWILRQKIGNELQKAHRHREQSLQQAFADGDRDADRPSLDPPDPGDDPATAYDRKETAARIREAMSHLSDFCRTVFAGLLEGYRIQDVWERYRDIEPGLRRSAFDKRTHDCRRKMMALLGTVE
jgi:DNA-directed RNA polymerase specialized sigma24 family protein